MELFVTVLILLCYAPPILYLRWHLKNLESPAYLRAKGVLIHRLEALEEHGPPIGRYMGCDIWEEVTFKGMHYTFDHVVQDIAEDRVGARQLYVAPGLIYVTH